LLALAAGFVFLLAPHDDAGRQRVGLFTSLPLMWAESPDLAAQLRPDAPRHWARGKLEDRGTLVPLDALADHDGDAEPLARLGMLVMAQPRPLSPLENVALDRWVRNGGHLLLFADPLLTAESSYALGDRRRPQDVVLLSPILARWGLALAFDDEQAAGEHLVEALGTRLPVNLPGQFDATPGSTCRIAPGGIAATCAIGKGRVIAIADAALFETDASKLAADRADVFAALVERAGPRD
jgi:hypothetical protein